jgi:hypothetical protein
MTSRKLLLGALLLLSACMSREERQARLDVQDDAKCQSLGAQPGTDAYVNCRVSMANVHAQEEASRQAAGMALMGFGLGMANPPPRPIYTTNCQSFGSQTNCTTIGP